MKAFAAALVAVFLLLLAGCSTTADLKALEIQDRAHERIVKFNDDAETRAARVFIEVNKEREKTKQEEAKAAVVRAGAIMKLGEKADAGGRVAMVRSLEERAPVAGAATAELAMPKPALMPVPTIQMPKSAVDRFLDLADRGVDKGIRIAGLVLNYKSLGKQLDADVRRTELLEEGQTARHGATMGAFGRFSDNQSASSIASAQAARDVAIKDAETPDIVQHVNGNDNNLAAGGSTANRTTTTNTTTNTVQCPQTQTARSGDSGTGGAGGTSTTGGNTAAPSGQTAPTTAAQTANCNAGK
jgi:hypothetical protein